MRAWMVGAVALVAAAAQAQTPDRGAFDAGNAAFRAAGGPGRVTSFGSVVRPFSFLSGEQFGYSARSGSLTGNSILQSVIGAGASQVDMLQGVLEVVPGTTITQGHAVGAYVKNTNPMYTGPGGVSAGVGVAYGGAGWAAADGAQVWGAAIALTDVGGAPGPLGRALTNEWDFNVYNTNTQIYAQHITGAWSAQPAVAYGYVVGNTGLGGRWTDGFITRDAAAYNALTIGTIPVANAPALSQNLRFRSESSAGVVGTVDVVANRGRQLNITSAGGRADLSVPAGFLSTSVALTNAGSAQSGQAGGVRLTTNRTRFGITQVNGAAVLPDTNDLPQGAATVLTIINDGAETLSVFPSAGQNINGLGVNAAMSVPSGTRAEVWCPGTGGTTWLR